MRKLVNLAALAAAILSIGFNQSADASLLGMPRNLKSAYEHIRLRNSDLAADGLLPVLPAL